MSIKAILFDLDETLVVESASVSEGFLATCELARQKHSVNPGVLQEMIRLRARELWRKGPCHPYCLRVGVSSWEGLAGQFTGSDRNLRSLREWVGGYRLAAWSRALADVGVDDPALAERLAETYPVERGRRNVPFPDAEAAIKDLGEDHRLGLLTNGAPDLQRGKLEGAGLAKYFDDVFISGEFGCGKPEAELFELALEGLRCLPADAAMVGDSLTRDIAGARQVGLTSVWVNRTGKQKDNAVVPDFEIRSLVELRGALSR